MNFIKNILLYSSISAIFVLHPGLNKGDNIITEIQNFVYGNSLELLVNSEINKNQLQVIWESKEDKSSILIYENGKEINKIPSSIGNQRIVVLYNHNVIGKIEHYKPTKNQAHKYNLSINSKNQAIFFKGEILGPAHIKSPATTTLPLASL